ncbi:hypothetical protein [Mucilaginibacter pocheonensis]|uniref:Uncharacterized protein n=1 Tax=Mucilaginibacter pocheonensis TaxID=398050 RepID=A0ABU1T9K8_9SPHI|nr:hypothetical protein [Mucilaginibacter pocheonensis]MDR6942081.1 hypothetical protein [Mucilaginibacter pocheonensis]
MKQTLIYSLKIWLTSVVIGPLIYIVHETKLQDLKGSAGFILYSIPYGLALSSLIWLLFWLSLHCIYQLNISTLTFKLYLSSIGFVLSLLPFFLIFGNDDPITYKEILPWALSYCIVIVAGVWFFKLKPSSYSVKT